MDEPQSWIDRAEALEAQELQEFRNSICIQPASHFHLNAIGSCSRCSRATPSSSMKICDSCASELKVCPFDLRLVGITKDHAEALTALWLALWMRGFSKERDAARGALEQSDSREAFESLQEMESRSQDRPVSRKAAPAPAEFIVGFRRIVPGSLSAGQTFLGGTVVSVNEKLHFAVIQTGDAATFEKTAAEDRSIQSIELNRW